jgi:hypothetical protein
MEGTSMYGTDIIATEERHRGHFSDHEEITTLVTVWVNPELVGPNDSPFNARHAAEQVVEGLVVSAQLERGPYETLGRDGYFDVTVVSFVESKKRH